MFVAVFAACAFIVAVWSAVFIGIFVFNVSIYAWDRLSPEQDHAQPIPTIQFSHPITDIESIPDKTYIKSLQHIGQCKADTFYAKLDVYLSTSLPEGVLGRFYLMDGQGVIELDKSNGMDINTIAHEVSHWVDRIVVAHALEGTEVRAYLQGYFTECVMSLVAKNV